MTPGPERDIHDSASAPEGGAWLPAGMPQDRAAHDAAQRSFEELQNAFVKAVSELQGRGAATLMMRVLDTREPADLLLLRRPVFTALRRQARQIAETRLYLQLRRTFPNDESLAPPLLVPLVPR